jgi:hypothetical protein
MGYLKKKTEDYFFNNQVAYCLIKFQRFNDAIKHWETAMLSQSKEDNESQNSMALQMHCLLVPLLARMETIKLLLILVQVK